MHWTLAFHPDGQRLAAGFVDQGRASIQVYDVATGAVTARLPQPQWCHGVAWHPDGRRLAVACEDLRIHLWDTAEQKELAAWGGPRQHGGLMVRGFNRSGDRLLSLDWSGVLRLWDTEAGQQVFTLPYSHDDVVARPDDTDGLLVVVSEGETVRLLRLVSSGEHRRL